MKTIDLNCDMGELKAGQSANFDEDILPFVSSCNIACGFHSGTPQIMKQTVLAAIRQDVKIGAHPSYNDRENFGRVSLKVEREVLLAEIHKQIGTLKEMAERLRGRLHHVKPHGALYNDIAADENLARDFVRLVKEIDPVLKIYALAGSCVMGICREEGMRPVSEGFADRRYESVNELRSRRHADAVLHTADEIKRQVDQFLIGQVQTINGDLGKLEVETLCLHSDTPGAVQLGKMIHDHLIENNVRISSIL